MSLAAPNSEVDICNIALQHLKQPPITSIDPASTTAEERCALNYHQVRQETLRSHAWNFAMKRVQLSPDLDNTPLFGFTHAYALPSDWLRYIGRYDDLGTRVSEDDYDIEGRYLLLNGEDSESVNLRYIYDHVTVSEMDPLFRGLFALNLAIVLAPSFSSTEQRLKALLEIRKDLETKATAIDGQERPPRRVQRSKFIEARRGGRHNLAGPYTYFQGA